MSSCTGAECIEDEANEANYREKYNSTRKKNKLLLTKMIKSYRIFI